MLEKVWRKGNPVAFMGMLTDTATMQHNMEIP